MTTFMEQLVIGTAEPKDIHDWVGRWHDGPSDDMSLRAWLGMTKEEYEEWVRDEYCLPRLVEYRIYQEEREQHHAKVAKKVVEEIVCQVFRVHTPWNLYLAETRQDVRETLKIIVRKALDEVDDDPY